MAEQHQFNSIALAGKTSSSQGALKLHKGGIVWKKAGGGKTVDLAQKDIKAVTYSKISQGFQLNVRDAKGTLVKFGGFRDADLKNVKAFIKENLDQDVVERSTVVNGHNWGEVMLHGPVMSFVPVNTTEMQETTPAHFDINLTDVSQVTATKNKVVMEFHLDDTGSAEEKDTLVDISFYVPPTSAAHVSTEEQPSAQVLKDALLEFANAGGGESGDSVAAFADIAGIVPRLKMDVTLSTSMVHLQGTTQDFRIKYTSLVRIFMLPKPNLPHTVVVLTLDPPIRSGKTFYAHVLLQFPTDEEIEIALDMEEAALAKYEGKLLPSYDGPSADVFCRVLKGLSGCKVTKPGVYVSAGGKKAVRCSQKAEDGYLFPLEKSFFYITKPATVLSYEEVAEVEFQRQGGALSLSSAKTFDLKVVLKSDAEYQFRNIARAEYDNLFAFVQAKGLKVVNLAQNDFASGAGLRLSDDESDDEVRPSRKERGAPAGGDDEESEEDEDFVMDGGSSDGGEPTDNSEEEDSDASEGGGGGSDSDAGDAASPKAKKKRPAEDSNASPAKKKHKKEKKDKKEKKSKKEKKEKAAKPSPKKKKKTVKDKSAPKRALSAYFIWMGENRNAIKAEDPSLSIGELGKKMGERWKMIDPEEKQKYEALAAEDKIRAATEKKAYDLKKKQDAAAAGSDDEAADSEEDEEMEGDESD